MDRSASPGIRIVQVFLEKVSFSHREDFLTHPPTAPVSTDAEITLSVGLTPDKSRGRVQIQVRSKDTDRSLYKFDLLMTALVEREGSGNLPLEDYLATNGGATLFPFVREALASITGRGRFGPVWIKPINVLAMVSQSSAGREMTAHPPVNRRATPKTSLSSRGKGRHR